jgi:hypothetical protein
MHILGMEAKTNRRQHSARFTFLDEVESYGPGWRSVLSRGKAFDGAMVVMLSQPGEAGSDIDQEFRLGTMEEWWVPCPHCGHYQVPQMGSRALKRGCLWWDEPEPARRHAATIAERAALARATACLLCVACGGKIHDHHKHTMNARGIYVPSRVPDDDWDPGKGTHTPTAADAKRWRTLQDEHEDRVRSARARASVLSIVDLQTERWIPGQGGGVASMRLSSLTSVLGTATYGELAGQIVEQTAGGGGVGVWGGGGDVNQDTVPVEIRREWLGLPSEVAGERVEVREVLAHALRVGPAPEGEGGYRHGTAPAGRVVNGRMIGGVAGGSAVLSVDVQLRALYLHVWGIGPFLGGPVNSVCNDRYLLWRERIDRVENGGLLELDGWLQIGPGQPVQDPKTGVCNVRSIPYADGSGRMLPIVYAIVDEGAFTHEVQAACERLRTLGLRVVTGRGRAGGDAALRGQPWLLGPATREAKDGERITAYPRLRKLSFDTDVYKSIWYYLVRNDPDAALREAARDAASAAGGVGGSVGGGGGGGGESIAAPSLYQSAIEDIRRVRPPRLLLPEADGSWDAAQFARFSTAEQRVIESTRGGGTRWVWKLRQGSDNHDLDCVTMAFARLDTLQPRRVGVTQSVTQRVTQDVPQSVPQSAPQGVPQTVRPGWSGAGGSSMAASARAALRGGN